MTETSSQIKCHICNDSGWHYYTDKNGYNMQDECPCGILKIKRMESRLRFANIPDAFKDLRFKDFTLTAYKTELGRNIARTAAKFCHEWATNYDVNKARGLGLYLYSNTKGSGKTRMAASIANYLMHEMNVPVKFATSMSIMDEIKSTWGRNDSYTESKLIDSLVTTEVLIIDDFGVEDNKSWINDRYYSIINGRYVDKKVTIFTSNMSLSDLSYDERIVNRIKEMCYEVPFPEESVRDNIALELRKEMVKIINEREKGKNN